MISLSVVQNQTFDRLMKMVDNPDFFAGWADRYLVPLYAQAQMDRWMTDGGSEGYPWADVSEPYATWKTKKYADFFGSGQKTLIATSRLLASVLPPSFRDGPEDPDGNENYRQVVSDKSIMISSAIQDNRGVNYGTYVDESRSFTKWSPETKQSFIDSFKRYLADRRKG